jgi:peptidoglycan/LPS O-acetylase OafA/YrhL
VTVSLGFSAASPGPIDRGALIFYSAVILAAWGLIGWKPGTGALAALAPIGAISFGIYAVGFAIEFSINKSPWLPSGSALSYILRALVLVTLTFGIAWILEHKLQPAVRKAFGKRPLASPANKT